MTIPRYIAIYAVATNSTLKEYARTKSLQRRYNIKCSLTHLVFTYTKIINEANRCSQ